jgi:hypothetical protein
MELRAYPPIHSIVAEKALKCRSFCYSGDCVDVIFVFSRPGAVKTKEVGSWPWNRKREFLVDFRYFRYDAV